MPAFCVYFSMPKIRFVRCPFSVEARTLEPFCFECFILLCGVFILWHLEWKKRFKNVFFMDSIWVETHERSR
jgi:hypothetical protein